MLPFATTKISVAITGTLLQQQGILIATIHFGCDIITNSNESKQRCCILTQHAMFIIWSQIPHLVATITILIATLKFLWQQVTLTQRNTTVAALNLRIATKFRVSQ